MRIGKVFFKERGRREEDKNKKSPAVGLLNQATFDATTITLP